MSPSVLESLQKQQSSLQDCHSALSGGRVLCSGVCQAEEELCNPDNLRCIEDPAYNKKSLGHNVAKDHHYCFLQVNNDAGYDYVTREDEAKVIGTNEPTVNYSRLIALKDKNDKGQEGFQCQNGFKFEPPAPALFGHMIFQ